VWAALIPGVAIALLAVAISAVADWLLDWTTGTVKTRANG
jgi:ABC-type dipeptide/oligopeptide/nickel transport system permease subunit